MEEIYNNELEKKEQKAKKKKFKIEWKDKQNTEVNNLKKKINADIEKVFKLEALRKKDNIIELTPQEKDLKMNILKNQSVQAELISYDENIKEFITINDVHKTYGKKKVLKGINLTINIGDRIAILGHNGSGKTTLSEIITGIKSGTSGEIIYHQSSSREEFGSQLGIQFQKLSYPEGYRVSEIIPFFNRMVDKSKRYSKDDLKELIELFGIDKFYKKSLTALSGGQQQRINLFLTFIKKPSFIILDELSTGLDIDIYQKVTELFKNYIIDNNVTLILVSHNLEEIKFFTEKSYILKEGKIAVEIPTSDLSDELFLKHIRRNEENLVSSFEFDLKESENSYDKSRIIRFYNGSKFSKYTSSLNINLEHFQKSLKKNKILVDDLLNKEEEIVSNEKEVTSKIENLNSQKTQLLARTTEIELLTLSDTTNISEDDTEELSNLNLTIKDVNGKLKVEKKFLQQIIKKNTKIELKIEKIEKIINFIYDHSIYRVNLKIDTLKTKQEKILKNQLNISKEIETKEFEETEKVFLLAKDEISKLINEQIKIKEQIIEFYKEVILNEDDFEDYLIVKNLRKYYEITPVLNNINLKIKKGSRVAITGPNGSGKTTLTEIIATTLDKTLGKITYWFTRNKFEARHSIGMQFQESSFPADLRVIDIIKLFHGASKYKISWEELMNLVTIFKLDHILKQGGEELSGGERQRLNVLISLLKKPELLILDEISTGLDVESIIDINNWINHYLDKTGATLLLISHNPAEVHRLAKELIILKEGKVLRIENIENKSVKDISELFMSIYKEDIK